MKFTDEYNVNIKGIKSKRKDCNQEHRKIYELTAIKQTYDAKALIAERKKYGYTQADLCLIFGTSLATVRHWEQGIRLPKPWVIEMLFRLMPVAVDQFLLIHKGYEEVALVGTKETVTAAFYKHGTTDVHAPDYLYRLDHAWNRLRHRGHVTEKVWVNKPDWWRLPEPPYKNL